MSQPKWKWSPKLSRAEGRVAGHVPLPTLARLLDEIDALYLDIGGRG